MGHAGQEHALGFAALLCLHFFKTQILIPPAHEKIDGKQGEQHNQDQNQLNGTVPGQSHADYVDILADEIIVERDHAKPVCAVNGHIAGIVQDALQLIHDHAGSVGLQIFLTASDGVLILKMCFPFQNGEQVSVCLQMSMVRPDNVVPVLRDDIAEKSSGMFTERQSAGYFVRIDPYGGGSQSVRIPDAVLQRDADEDQILTIQLFFKGNDRSCECLVRKDGLCHIRENSVFREDI